jgi:phosphatidylglycerol:prolipoprotein diacylglycerol transferase
MQGYYQATFFYESFFNFIGFIFLFILAYRLAGRYKGLVISGYCIWYGAVRAVVEGLRSDSLYTGDLRVSQMLSLALIVFGVAAAAYIIVKKEIFKDKQKAAKN